LFNTMIDNHFTLFCLVDGEATSNVFSVEIDPTKTVGGLKKVIKAKMTPRFDDVAADELTPWCVSIPDDDDVDDDDEQSILLDNVSEKKK
ncbi:hypothetical protein BGZ58_011269, partial [Dissophora ornata]